MANGNREPQVQMLGDTPFPLINNWGHAHSAHLEHIIALGLSTPYDAGDAQEF